MKALDHGQNIQASEMFVCVLKTQIPHYTKQTKSFFDTWICTQVSEIASIYYPNLLTPQRIHVKRWQGDISRESNPPRRRDHSSVSWALHTWRQGPRQDDLHPGIPASIPYRIH